MIRLKKYIFNIYIDKSNTIKEKLLFLFSRNRKQKRKTETVGVTQLVKSIKLIDRDEFPWDDNIPDRVAYYPVIVLEDARLITPGLSGIINQWYKDLIDKELPGQMCYPIIVMSMDTLILYTPLFHQKGFFAIFDKFF